MVSVPAPQAAHPEVASLAAMDKPFGRAFRRLQSLLDGAQRAVRRWPALESSFTRARQRAGRLKPWLFPGGLPASEVDEARSLFPPPPAGQGGPRVLIVSFRAWPAHAAIEVTLGHALAQRGAQVDLVRCGGGLPICEMGWRARERPDPCLSCSGYVEAMATAAGLPLHSLTSYLSPAEIEAAGRHHQPVDPKLDEAIEQSALWHFKSGQLDRSQPEIAAGLEDLRRAARIVSEAAPRMLADLEPDIIVLLNGLFFEERIIAEHASAGGARVISYEMGTQRQTLVFSSDPSTPAPELDVSDLWELHGHEPLSEQEQDRLDAVLRGRRGGDALPRRYYDAPQEAQEGSERRRTIVLFTNVSWDTAVTGKQFAFPTMFDWIDATIELVAADPELELVIRIHPAETRWPGLETRERAADHVERRFGRLPDRVRVVGPDDPVDTYALIDVADVVAVFSSTVGLEAAALGKAVVVTGKTHYRGHGFTFDATGPDEYASLLRQSEPSPERTDLSRRYAYLFFEHRLVPFRAVDENPRGRPTFTFPDVGALREGEDPMLDLICRGILDGDPFHVPVTNEQTERQP